MEKVFVQYNQQEEKTQQYVAHIAEDVVKSTTQMKNEEEDTMKEGEG